MHQILHNQGIEYANEFAHVFAHILAFAHVHKEWVTILQVKNEFGEPFSSVLEQVLSSGGRQAVEEIWRSDLSCIVCNRGGDTCEKYYAV